MKTFEIKCLSSVGPVQLGMTMGEVINVLGEPEFINGKRYCFLFGLMVDFDSNDLAQFIEAASSDLYTIVFEGNDVHRTQASKMIELVSLKDDYDREDPELGYSYIFKSFQLSLWRSVIPENESDLEGRYFESVGIGYEGCFE
ncbi:hypothetical protein L4D21_23385 [Photobacterium profundum]|uniref:hypothetical protein n=1 Tax=Photobacterium profundum TaxID=74109 RepID=UPI003D111C3F